jgi:hypothetical protein
VAGFEPKVCGVAVAKNAGFSLWYPAYVVLYKPALNELVGVGVGVGVSVRVGVIVLVGVTVFVGVRVGVRVLVGVTVFVGVGVLVGVGVGLTANSISILL